MPKPIDWAGGRIKFLDQTKLPGSESYIETDDYSAIVEAIKQLRLRGAPLIGVAAGYGLAAAAVSSRTADPRDLLSELEEAKAALDATRPTAVDLFKATGRVFNAAASQNSSKSMKDAAVREAQAIFAETERADIELSRLGADLINDGDTVLTICNTGALATGAYGTALGVIRTAYDQGKEISVFACETRPLLQGARLTMWELDRLGIPAKLIVDSAAGHFMRRGEISKVITGADRIAANGDTANKIGTYTLAALADRHEVPFYIAAPVSTVDLETLDGERITVEERGPDEVTGFNGVRVAPDDAEARNPAFDVTPAGLISAIITNGGIVYPPYVESIAGIFLGKAR
ncbi:MAG: S-methyl-5-thioribose-1-phosphate isomerase [Actinomycetota bacterium]